MRFLCCALLLAAASAFTPNVAFTKTATPQVSVADESAAHRTRKATIVMDGKANGRFRVYFNSKTVQEGRSDDGYDPV